MTTAEIVMPSSNGEWLKNVIERTILDDLEADGKDEVDSIFDDEKDYDENYEEMMEEEEEDDEDDIEYIGTTNECCICYNMLECLKLSCCNSAYYCLKCFDKWDSESDSCAICRQETCILIE